MREMAVDNSVTARFASGPFVFHAIHAAVARTHPAILKGFQSFLSFLGNCLRRSLMGGHHTLIYQKSLVMMW
jgi:hypothetical protein